MERFIFLLELIGTVSFAASGAMTGLKKNMDIFGVCILGLTTAVGGGVIRDLVLGNTPPNTFRNPVYATVALVTSAVFFLKAVRRFLLRDPRRYNRGMLVMDSLGLGAFTTVGIQVAFTHTESPTLFLLVFVGVITGVGGGVIRDLLAGDMPYILVKHVYATASLAGALLCVALWPRVGSMGAMMAGTALIVVIRFLSAHYHWNLPKAHD